MKLNNHCNSCGQSSLCHINSWIEEICRQILPVPRLSRRMMDYTEYALEKIFTVFKLAKYRDDFSINDIQLRTFVFIDEMRKKGASFQILNSFAGFTSHVKMRLNDRIFRFESLPTSDYLSKYSTNIIDDKVLAKAHCEKGRFPIADGKSFWFWQKERAIKYAKKFGYPLVVKPRGGSVSRHVTTNINNDGQLEKAIKYSIAYSPSFIIERFIADAFVVRATVIDFDFVACVQQIPANVVGDGVSTIQSLIDNKNNQTNRGYPNQNQFTLNKIIVDETTDELLKKINLNYGSIPKIGKVIYLQKNPFLKLGGDLNEITSNVHPDNITLFKDLARHFDIRLTGIDFLIKDMSKSYKEQSCAILELNSLPCIELHHFPYKGKPTNPAEALSNMFIKYYL